jgi:hypothetical protein
VKPVIGLVNGVQGNFQLEEHLCVSPFPKFYLTIKNMKFISKIPIPSKEFVENNPEWKIVACSKKIILPGIILGLVLTVLTDTFITHAILGTSFSFKIFPNIYLFFLIIIPHEIIHLLFFPNFKNSTVGFSAKKMIFFVTTNEQFTKARLLTSTIAPLFFLSIIPISLLPFYNIRLIAYIALFNLLGSGADIISFFRIVKLPNNQIYRFNGPELYAKPIFERRTHIQ